jgi:tetratricopeptide (TPR) repeat protein
MFLNRNISLIALILLFLVTMAGPVFAQNSPEANVERAEKLIVEGKLQEAYDIYTALWISDASNTYYRFRVGLLKGWMGNFEASENHLRELVSDYPANLEYRMALVRVLSWQEKFDDVYIAADKLIQIDPQYAASYGLKSQALLWDSRRMRAQKIAHKALEIDSTESISTAVLESLTTEMAPVLESFYVRPWDSDRTYLHILGQRLQFGILPGLMGTFSWTYIDTENKNSGVGAESWNTNFGVTYIHNRNWLYRGGIGFSSYPNSTLGIGTNASIQYSHKRSINNISFNRYGLNEAPGLILNRIFANIIKLNSRLALDLHEFEVEPEVMFLSDDNYRLGFLATYRYKIEKGPFSIQPGARYRIQGFERTVLGQGYFSPKVSNWLAVTGDINWMSENNRYYATTNAEVGLQRITLHGQNPNDPSMSYSFNLLAGTQFNEKFHAEAGYLYSNLLNISSQASTGIENYWYQMWQIRVRIFFDKKYNPLTRGVYK